jgi:hypothetical protein
MFMLKFKIIISILGSILLVGCATPDKIITYDQKTIPAKLKVDDSKLLFKDNYNLSGISVYKCIQKDKKYEWSIFEIQDQNSSFNVYDSSFEVKYRWYSGSKANLDWLLLENKDKKLTVQLVNTKGGGEPVTLCGEAYLNKIEKMIAHPLSVLLQIKEQINQAICPSSHKNEFHQMDCFDFIQKMRNENRKIDVGYYDTPYPYVSSGHYSKIYSVIDSIFEGRKDLEIEDDAFTGKEALKNFEKMFALSEFIPKWVISLGCSNEKGIKGEELLAVVQKFRPATLEYLEHSWTVCNITKTVRGGGRRQEDNVEYLIVTK